MHTRWRSGPGLPGRIGDRYTRFAAIWMIPPGVAA
ncbi:hypothetical protein J2853_008035 [Streptosporangium lutulentum]|uniref:Uncharacterized protein n=1 Tax=Streptosporangium lutulentum TaxID=1461250 RepID=A0ABT9QS04_9ACTN|nr:hypothetical protein [Streptosporangium lutulentum]